MLSVSGKHPIFKPLIQLILLVSMIAPLKIVDEEGDPSGITSAEWILLERYRRGGQIESWSQSDKATLMRAFQKACDYSMMSQ